MEDREQAQARLPAGFYLAFAPDWGWFVTQRESPTKTGFKPVSMSYAKTTEEAVNNFLR